MQHAAFAIFWTIVTILVGACVLAGLIDIGQTIAKRWREREETDFRVVMFACVAAIIATQIGCTWWLDQRRAADLSSIHYNTEYVKLAADQWESGQSAVKCK